MNLNFLIDEFSKYSQQGTFLSVFHKESILFFISAELYRYFKLLFVGNRVVKHDKEDHPMSVNDA